jgi:hypothetical protein
MAQNMLTKAQKIAKDAPDIQFAVSHFFQNKTEAITNLTSNFRDANKEITIILNYCYLFASLSLEIDDFVKFTNAFKAMSPQARFVIFQQNPDLSKLNSKWDIYKSRLVVVMS